MPQILDAFVCFASMMQRYEFFVNLASFLPIIFQKKNRGSFSLFHFLTFDISIFEICQPKIFHLYYYI